ncbi:MAG: hypothetical protein ACRC7C_19625 [Beijerinckiaceae bacterium]
MNHDNLEKAGIAIKLAAVWGLVGVSTLEEAATLASLVAACLAGFYTFLLITQWFVKHFWIPLFMHFGLFGFKRRILTLEEAAREADE